jgi:ribosomal protein S13
MYLVYRQSIFAEFMKIYGINKSSSLKMCKHIRVSPNISSNSINPIKKRTALNFIKKYKKISFDLKDLEIQKFVHLYTIKHLKPLKHKYFLPINGQRNCTNGHTARNQAKRLRPIIYKQLKKIAKRKKISVK